MGGKHTDSQVVELIDELLAQAIKAGASDVHFEPGGEEMVVKYRLDGVLEQVEKLPKFLSDNIISRLKVMGGLLTYRTDIPQEGRIAGSEQSSPAGRVTDKRLAVFPTVHGQRAVVRLFYETDDLTQLEQLGFSGYICSALKNFAAKNQGVLLLTGPAGSGKSTTMAALLRYILRNFEGKSIVAIEDPVERIIQGVTQVQIPPSGEMTFPVALRSLLRQDPEVLMIGEIRDAETARIVIEAGLTGHLMLSTMHSGSCAGALLRLLEMAVEPYQVTSSISAVLNQRLVRKLCNKCAKKDPQTGRMQPVGCHECFQTGFKGRILIAELVEPDGRLRKALLAKADLDELEAILKHRGHMNIAQDGIRLVSEGLTCRQEVEKVCG